MGKLYGRFVAVTHALVNSLFAASIVQNYKAGDIIWINDYHLMLVPSMVRMQLPSATIGFFLHIPFPSSEIYRCLHVRNQILLGILGADLVGFQTYSFMRHFLMTSTRLLAIESTPRGIQLDDSMISVGIFPIGINVSF
jgi:trehalose-6-phosphate synthase